MKVLVLGGAGYIGSHTARVLRRHGHQAIIYDNLSTGHEFLAKGFELIVADIADSVALRSILGKVDAVMHFAAHAYVAESVANPRKYLRNNVESAITLLNALLDAGVGKLIFSSSCAVYGIPATVPIPEDAVREPVNPYGATKLFFEHALAAYDRAYGLRSATLRYFNAAGADESGEIGELHDPETHVIPLALDAVAGGPPLRVYGMDYPTPDGTCVRDYVHVNDLAEAHVSALEKLTASTTSFTVNLGCGRGYSIHELMRCISQVTGRAVPHEFAGRRDGDPPILVANPTLAHQLLGWKPRRDLHDIISTAWNWMQRSRKVLRASA